MRLRKRKLVQWALGYLAGAGVVYSAFSGPHEIWGVTEGQLKILQVLLAVGFFIALVLAWYHGEKGEQRVSAPEGILLTAIVALGAVGLSLVGAPTSHDPARHLVHGHRNQSRQVLSRLVEWADSHELSSLRRGHALHDAGRHADAEPLLRQAVAEAPTGAALGLLAMSLEHLGRAGEADPLIAKLESGEGVVFYGDHAPEEFPASRWPAIVAASRGERNRAVMLLRSAYELGLRYYDLNQMQIHIRPELMVLQDHPGYRKLVAPRPYFDGLER